MHFPRIYLIAILLLAFGIFASGQDPPKASLYDEFSEPTCEVLWAQLDGLTQEMRENPTVRATIEISGKPGEPHVNLYWEQMIQGYLARSIANERWNLVRTPLGKQRVVRFLLTPTGATLPKIESADWSLEYPPDTKPFILTNGKSYSVEVGVCLAVDELALLAEMLKNNAGSRVNVVLVVRSTREFERRKRQALKTLTSQYAIPVSRIRIFRQARTKPNPYGIEPDAEYWFIP
jgi:hypothetical protein